MRAMVFSRKYEVDLICTPKTGSSDILSSLVQNIHKVVGSFFKSGGRLPKSYPTNQRLLDLAEVQRSLSKAIQSS